MFLKVKIEFDKNKAILRSLGLLGIINTISSLKILEKSDEKDFWRMLCFCNDLKSIGIKRIKKNNVCNPNSFWTLQAPHLPASLYCTHWGEAKCRIMPPIFEVDRPLLEIKFFWKQGFRQFQSFSWKLD
jgi:hypothetical protein